MCREASCVNSNQAARAYSWMRPPRRSRRIDLDRGAGRAADPDVVDQDVEPPQRSTTDPTGGGVETSVSGTNVSAPELSAAIMCSVSSSHSRTLVEEGHRGDFPGEEDGDGAAVADAGSARASLGHDRDLALQAARHQGVSR
ncbi:MAG TPA: hypothetical protein VGU71_06565 [Candidatus Dormibacteraeota bacterium]|nr:hypothetical protein [Candidatus Dormibacteraeota bacterium]